ncbi:MAG: hypothetical protein ABIO79_11165 [Ferruginibacter sp.]
MDGFKAGYWEGFSRAKIEESEIYCDWKHDSENSKRIVFMNQILAFWYSARRSGSPYQSEIDGMLDDAGTEGMGSSDFENFLNDYERLGFITNKYDDLRTYFGSSNSLFYHTQIKVPAAFKFFAESIEEKLEPLKGHCNQFNWDVKNLNTLFSQNDWGEIKKVLEKLGKYSENAQKFLWVYPRGNRIVKGFTTYNDALSKIHDGLSDYAMLAHGQGDLSFYALQKAASFVPVLGSYYGAMVSMLPILEDWFQGVIDNHCRKLDAAARGMIMGQN